MMAFALICIEPRRSSTRLQAGRRAAASEAHVADHVWRRPAGPGRRRRRRPLCVWTVSRPGPRRRRPPRTARRLSWRRRADGGTTIWRRPAACAHLAAGVQKYAAVTRTHTQLGTVVWRGRAQLAATCNNLLIGSPPMCCAARTGSQPAGRAPSAARGPRVHVYTSALRAGPAGRRRR
jgi:hypothetical protein